MKQCEGITGTKSYAGAEAAHLLHIGKICSDTFDQYGYERIILPVLERSDIFLQRSGEEIRRRMYILQDPGGREICLRPEMTISVARTFLETMSSRRFPVRLSYQGEVFRYDKVREGRYRQFLQAGVENIGSKNQVASDVETVTLALETIRNVGVLDYRLLLGDLSLTAEFINSLPAPIGIRTRLLENFWRREAFESLLEQFSQRPSSENSNSDSMTSELAETLSAMGEGASHSLVRQILSLFVEKGIGHRDLDEIAERFLHRLLTGETTALPQECFEALREYLSITGPPEDVLTQLKDLLQKIGTSAGPAFESLQRRIELLSKQGVLPANVQLDLGFRRGIEYYTGFIFEIHCDRIGRPISQVCGGGRYDRLFSALGAPTSIPAVGFAIGINRLLLALQKSGIEHEGQTGGSIDAVVVAVGQVGEERVWEIAQICRKAGWRVSADFDSKRLSDALGRASEGKIPFVIIAGEDELHKQTVRIKDMMRREENVVQLEDLNTFVRSATSTGR